MRICTLPETADEYTDRVAALLDASSTHLYFDTSFLMWLTTVGDEARKQFVKWADGMAGRTHVPLWSMHEYQRHHAAETLRGRVARRVEELQNAAKAFQSEMRGYSDQPLLSGLPAAAYQTAISDVVGRVRELGDAATTWDYRSASDAVAAWMNDRCVRSRTVFRSLASVSVEGAARFTQDVPPGFLDRRKEDKPTKGSNRYGDLLFWQEVVWHAGNVDATDVVVVTRDRKADWYSDDVRPEWSSHVKRLDAKWLPVPRPHPTLAFELRIETGADLILMDELYLGAILWKFRRPAMERLAAVAIDVSPESLAEASRPPRTAGERALKRREASLVGMTRAHRLVVAAFESPVAEVSALAHRLDASAPEVEAFVATLGPETVAGLALEKITSFARILHDRSKSGPGPAATAVAILLDGIDRFAPDTAAALYAGFLCSAYFAEGRPLDRPDSPFFDDLCEWQVDTALTEVVRAVGRRLDRDRSAVLYRPIGRRDSLTLRFENGIDQRQDPVVLGQVYLGARALLRSTQVRDGFQLFTLLGDVADVRSIVRTICRHFGLPESFVTIEGAEEEDQRSIPSLIGFREFDRFGVGDAVEQFDDMAHEAEADAGADLSVDEDEYYDDEEDD